MKIDRGHITKGLMGSMEIVFHEPLGQPMVEFVAISRKIPHLDEFFP
jgi:hypothetical protein